MPRRSVFTAFGFVVAFILGTMFSRQPLPANAQAAQGAQLPHGPCVNVTAVQHSLGVVNVYRAFLDGAVEVSSSNQANQHTKWQPVGN
jgi:hypothetical protein